MDTRKNEVEMRKNRADAGNSGTDKRKSGTGIGALERIRSVEPINGKMEQIRGRAEQAAVKAERESDFSQKQVKEAFRGKKQ